MTDKLLPCPFCGSPDIDPTGVASIKKGVRDRVGFWKDAKPEEIEERPACRSCNATTDGDWNSRKAEKLYEWLVWRRPNGTCFYDTIFSQPENKGEKVVGSFCERDDAKLFCAFMSDVNFCKQAIQRISLGGRLNIQIAITDAPDPIDLSKIPLISESTGLSPSQTEAAKK